MKTAKELREITLEARETLLDKKLYEISRSILFKANNGETRYEFSLRAGLLPKAFEKGLVLGIEKELVKKGYTVTLKKPSFFSTPYYTLIIRW